MYPDQTPATAFLGFTYFEEWFFWKPTPRVLERGFELVQRAISLDDTLPEAHTFLGGAYTANKQYEEAIAECERGITLNPNYADGYAWLGVTLCFANKPEDAVERVAIQAGRQ